MTDEELLACPECDSPSISTASEEYDYLCIDCYTHFDKEEAVVRERERPSFRKGLARELEEMDPDDI